MAKRIVKKQGISEWRKEVKEYLKTAKIAKIRTPNYAKKSTPKSRKRHRRLIKKKKKNNLIAKYQNYRVRLKFYSSPGWKKVRSVAFMVYGVECRKCGSTENPNVDHIVPIKVNPKKRLNLMNLQILCSDCNGEKLNRTVDYRTSDDINEMLGFIEDRWRYRKCQTNQQK